MSTLAFMSNSLRCLLVSVVFTAGILSAQNEAPIAEPKYINGFSAVDASGKLIELERQTVTFHSKVRTLPGYASVKMTSQFKPGRSPVRLAATTQFVVRGRAPIDPLSRYELRMLKASKDHREFVATQGRGSILGGSSTSNPDEGAVAIRFEEYGAGSYRITPDKPLAPGEYALATRGFASELHCFGVDHQ